MDIQEIKCKTILTKSGVSDYSLNPYIGCEHNCLYCYADFMSKWHGNGEKWGEFVKVKINAPEVLKEELEKKSLGRIFISSICDPYQPIEAEYKLTRACLDIVLNKVRQNEEFRNHKRQDSLFPLTPEFHISILTKSILILRDIELIKKFDNLEAGFTITTLDDKLARIFEPKASLPRDRLQVLRKLKEEGIKTYAFVGPILPYFSDNQKTLEKIFSSIKKAGVDYVLVDKMNYIERKRKLWLAYQKFGQEALKQLKYACSQEYAEELKTTIKHLANQTDLLAKICY